MYVGLSVVTAGKLVFAHNIEKRNNTHSLTVRLTQKTKDIAKMKYNIPVKHTDQ